jgi:antirestriction protein
MENRATPEPPGDPAEGRADHAEQLAEPPRIWVVSLSDYTHGHLHGAWLDAARPAEELTADVEQLLALAPSPDAEEWAIFDYDGFGPVTTDLGEYEPLERISAIARGIAEHGAAFSAYLSTLDGVWQVDDETSQRFQEAYLGDWPSLTAYAEHQLEELGVIEQLDQLVTEHLAQLRPYVRVDIEAYARDLEITLDVVRHACGVWVFDLNQ